MNRTVYIFSPIFNVLLAFFFSFFLNFAVIISVSLGFDLQFIPDSCVCMSLHAIFGSNFVTFTDLQWKRIS